MKIEFIPSSRDVELLVPEPKPASKYIPEWYRKEKIYNGGSNIDSIENDNMGIKSCVPFLDSMMNGYIQETWCDIAISYDENTKEVRCMYPGEIPMVSVRDHSNVPIPENFYPIEFAWANPWTPKLPKGYSAFITNPVNHVELFTYTLTGIIDSDVFYHQPFGNYPFYVSRNFSGIIPAGTPMFQIIPIKREEWKSKRIRFDEDKEKINTFKIRKHLLNSYKKNFHIKKIFSEGKR